MSDKPQQNPTDQARNAERAEHEWEGDYRPVSPEAPPRAAQVQVDPLQTEFLIRLADTLNTTLDLRTLLERTASLVRAVIDYKIFAILLINDRTHDLRMRFQIGHRPEIERLRIRMGQGIVGQVAQTRQAMLINDVSKTANYIDANPDVRSELAVPADHEESGHRRDRYSVRAAELLQAGASAPAHADRLAHRRSH